MHAPRARFNIEEFLQTSGIGRRLVRLVPKETFFVQGGDSDCTFYLREGRVKLTVVSKTGKEATIGVLAPYDFLGEDAASSDAAIRLSTATATTPCVALRIERMELLRVLHGENAFSHLFVNYLLCRCVRVQSDLIDQLFNSSEKRLARILLLMADFGEPGAQETLLPPITQESLAEMVGTTRSRVSVFMNRFRKLGFIEYDGRIRVHKSLLRVVLYDDLPERGHARAAPLLKSGSSARGDA